MHDSSLTTIVAADPSLHQRIQGVITQTLGTTSITDTEQRLLDRLDPAWVAVKVAGNPTIRAGIRTALDGGVNSVTEAVETGLTDSDLEYVVLSELSFLAD